VYAEPVPAAVYDAGGAPVGVTGRLAVTAAPARVAIADERVPVEVAGWAGPWPVDERWWTVHSSDAEDEPRRYVRFQVLLADGRALLLALSDGRWRVEALYD
jgi:protein ImuB